MKVLSSILYKAAIVFAQISIAKKKKHLKINDALSKL